MKTLATRSLIIVLELPVRLALLYVMLWAFAPRVEAQIAVPPESPPYTIVEATFAPPAAGDDDKVSVLWEGSDGVDLRVIPGDGLSVYVVAPPGTHSLEVIYVNWDSKNIGKDAVEFRIGRPEPPPPPPVPTGDLAKLVPDPTHRAQLSEFFRDLAGVVASGVIDTTAHFRSTMRDAVAAGKDAGTLPDAPQINAPISELLEDAIGLETQPLDAELRQKLTDTLTAIADDFGGRA